MLTNTLAWIKAHPAKLLGAPLFLMMVASIFYTAGWGIFDDTLLRLGTFTLSCVILLYASMTRQERHWWARLIDLGLLLAVLAAAYRYFWVAEELETGLYELEMPDILMALAGLAVLGELMRRMIGLTLLLVCGLAACYALFGRELPGGLAHAGMDLAQMLTTVWYSFDGVFGSTLGVVTSTILIFILFGALLDALGVGVVLLKLSFRLTRHLPGGDAHAAVLASGLFGTISGSSVANVVGTGVITIPMIKKSGFSGRFAGAVEAAASSGGQLMPPIMGAVAFIMADVTGISYLNITLAALIPAIFYYASLFTFISTEAKRLGMKAQGKDAVEPLTRLEKLKGLAFVVPLGLIIVLMVQGSSPAQAGFWALIAAAALGVAVDPGLLKKPAQLWQMVVNGAKSAATIMVAVAAVGIIIAVMNATGLGLRFSEAIQMVAGDSLFVSLLLMAGGCLVLGMGMPTVPAYLVIILVMGPAVQALGVELIAAHLFVVYYAVLSAVTPPVALAAFAAAPIAQANPLRVSVTSLRLAVIGFLIPFAFVYQPSMLLINDSFSWGGLAMALLTTTAAILLVAAAFSARGLKQGLYLLAGFAVIAPLWWVQLLALALLPVLLLERKGQAGTTWQRLFCKQP
ncbi:TRAP transporter permease [Marinobacterium weihaiense]|uniref:TRAP transporter fused permease subunit n=1 Tax=Marinobacterium weihaiense TaxID=2851016 RepID=A0ABS6MD89_9GAMM|nr:TRAP transporter fused permease subunit [Marinobacterium weihaiense]MBV0934265.1 TRAP transporter fused permease subunit [Marinobacterium weihaiense]